PGQPTAAGGRRRWCTSTTSWCQTTSPSSPPASPRCQAATTAPSSPTWPCAPQRQAEPTRGGPAGHGWECRGGCSSNRCSLEGALTWPDAVLVTKREGFRYESAGSSGSRPGGKVQGIRAHRPPQHSD